MSTSLDLLTDACVALPHTARRMFGGHGFFAPNGGMFAGIVTDEQIILKLEEGPARDELVSLGGHAWIYDGADRPMTMASWIVIPEAFMDDAEALARWTRRAHALVPAKKAKAASKRAKPARKAAVKKTSAKKAKKRA